MTTHRRSKARFKSARAAWHDIARATGKRASAVKRRAHTARHWVFVTR